MKLFNRKILISLCGLMLATSFAANGQLSSSLGADSAKEGKKKWQVQAVASSESNFLSSDSPDASAESSLILNPSYSLNSKWSLGTSVGYIQNHDDEQTSEATNAKIYMAREAFALFGSSLKFAETFALYLPTNQKEREIDSFQGAIEYDPKLSFMNSIGGYVLSTTLRARFKKNFHEYSLSEQANPNISHSISPSIFSGLGLGKTGLSAGVEVGLVQAWTYRGTPRSFYSISESLTWAVNENFILQVGHGNGGATWRADGRTYDVSLFDKYSSTYFMSATGIF